MKNHSMALKYEFLKVSPCCSYLSRSFVNLSFNLKLKLTHTLLDVSELSVTVSEVQSSLSSAVHVVLLCFRQSLTDPQSRLHGQTLQA